MAKAVAAPVDASEVAEAVEDMSETASDEPSDADASHKVGAVRASSNNRYVLPKSTSDDAAASASTVKDQDQGVDEAYTDAQVLQDTAEVIETADASEAEDVVKTYPVRSNTEGAYITGNAVNNAVYLTFDDGPDDRITEKVLDILEDYGVPASFFVIGSYVERYPDLIKRAHDEGHYVGGHTYGHVKLTSMSYNDIKWELARTEEIIANITGSTHKFMRPPFGAVNNTVNQAAADLGEYVVNWSIDPRDWSNPGTQKIFDNIRDNLHPGAIILMHSFRAMDQTAEILPQVIEYIQNQGYTFSTIDKMLD